MKEPTQAGWYWATVHGEREVVYFNQTGTVAVAGDERLLGVDAFTDWSERLHDPLPQS